MQSSGTEIVDTIVEQVINSDLVDACMDNNEVVWKVVKLQSFSHLNCQLLLTGVPVLMS